MTPNKSILIVDDDPNLVQLMSVVMTEAGYATIMADNGFDALRKAMEEKPDLVIMDVMMPGMNGIEATRQLRTNPATQHIPVIILSAKEQVNDRISGFEAGADDYVSKPVSPKELVYRVKAVLARSGMTQAAVCRTIAFVGAKGGVGVTTAATNVAAALTGQHKSVVYIEFRPHTGSAIYHFKLNSNETLGELLGRDPEAIKRQEVEKCLVKHQSGLRLLLAPQQATAGQLTAGHTDKILEMLETGADYLILDLPPFINEAEKRALELSDQILLVTEPSFYSVACAQALLTKFRDWGLFSRTDLVAIHRVRSSKSLSQVEIETKVGMKRTQRLFTRWDSNQMQRQRQFEQGVCAIVPAAPEMFDEAVNGRAPYVLIEPSAPSASELLNLADWISEKFG